MNIKINGNVANVTLTESEAKDSDVYKNGKLTEMIHTSLVVIFINKLLKDGEYSVDDVIDNGNDLYLSDMDEDIENCEIEFKVDIDGSAAKKEAVNGNSDNEDSDNVEDNEDVAEEEEEEPVKNPVKNEEKAPEPEADIPTSETVVDDNGASEMLEFMVKAVKMHNHIGCDGFPMKGSTPYIINDFALERMAVKHLFDKNMSAMSLNDEQKSVLFGFLDNVKTRYTMKYADHKGYKVSPEVLTKVIPFLLFKNVTTKGVRYIAVRNGVMTETDKDGRTRVKKDGTPVFNYKLEYGETLSETLKRFMSTQTITLLTKV